MANFTAGFEIAGHDSGHDSERCCSITCNDNSISSYNFDQGLIVHILELSWKSQRNSNLQRPASPDQEHFQPFYFLEQVPISQSSCNAISSESGIFGKGYPTLVHIFELIQNTVNQRNNSIQRRPRTLPTLLLDFRSNKFHNQAAMLLAARVEIF